MEDDLTLEFEAELWPWEARRELWTFVTVPPVHAADIRELAGDLPRGFGAVRVTARVGLTVWRTSIFPQSSDGAYVLPIKRAVRNAHGLEVGDPVRVQLELHP